MKLNFMPSLTKSIWALLICMSTAGAVSAAEKRLSPAQLLEIEDQRLALTPKDIIEQSMPKLNYSNDDYYLDRIHKLAYTFPIGITPGGQKVELVDQSKWYVNSVQRNQACNWVQSDTIFIKPKSSCFSMYPYVLYNRTTHEAVEVQFLEMPRNTAYNHSNYRQKIEKIDPYNRIVQLDDPEHTVWQISFSDPGFNYWKVGDYILVGVNNDWRIATHPHILINVSDISTPSCEGSFYGYGL